MILDYKIKLINKIKRKEEKQKSRKTFFYLERKFFA